MRRDVIREALEEIRNRDPSKLLRPEAVVEAARDESSPLHSKFEWDDTKAAAAHRLAQAAHLIRVCVTVLPNTSQPVRVYASLPSDRASEGGYRPITAVLASEDLRSQLLDQALKDLTAFKNKYEHLKELAPVVLAANQVEKAVKSAAGKSNSKKVVA